MIRVTLILIFSFICVKHVAAFDYVFTQAEYDETKRIALEILNRYPPSEYIYVGLGRSPTSVIAFLENLGIEHVVNQPLSDMILYPLIKEPQKNGPSRIVEIADPEKRVFSHFKRFMPDKVLGTQKPILFFDYAYSSKSLGDSADLLRAYLHDRGFKNALKTLALIGSTSSSNPKVITRYETTGRVSPYRMPEGMDSIEINDILLNSLEGQQDYSRYGKAPWHQDASNVKRNPAYKRFRIQLKKLMMKDVTLKSKIEVMVSLCFQNRLNKLFK